MDNVLYQIGRQEPLFQEDLKSVDSEFSREIENSRFLVVGGAGSIGGAVVRTHPRLTGDAGRRADPVVLAVAIELGRRDSAD